MRNILKRWSFIIVYDYTAMNWRIIWVGFYDVDAWQIFAFIVVFIV